MEAQQKRKSCIVAVGSTEFEELIKALDIQEFIQLLEYVNITDLLIQYGNGTYIPQNLKSTPKLTVKLESFIVLDTLINEADLVISHCGAGILLECLRSDHAINIAVVNDTLMHNHQSELADKLSSEGHIFQTASTLVLEKVREVIWRMKEESKEEIIKDYPRAQDGLIINLIDEMIFN
eukprot:403353799